MSKHPTKPASYRLSYDEQNKKILSEALALAEEYNTGYSGTRQITPLMSERVVKRSLATNSEATYSVRKHHALRELSNFALLLQKNKTVTASADNRDLLPLAHPQASRFHMVNDYSIQVARARYWADDPMITDSLVPSLIASALTAPPRSGEREYALARLTAMGSHKVPRGALVAAFNDGANDGFWRQQLRDLEGRFADMGRGLRFRVRRAADGVVRWLMGDTVSTDVRSNTFTIETPDGKLYKAPANASQSVKAILDGDGDAVDGYSKNPAPTKAGDVVVDEADLVELEAPDGWEIDPDFRPGQDELDYYGTDEDLGTAYRTGNYQVVKYGKGQNAAAHKFELQQKREADGKNVVAFGKGEDGELNPDLPLYFLRRNEPNARTIAAVQSWKDIQNLIEQDEPLYADAQDANPERPQNEKELPPTELEVGEQVDLNKYRDKGARIKGKPRANALKVRQYEKMLKKYREEGAEFPIDPRREHFILDDGTIIDVETGVVLRDSKGRSNPDAWKADEPEQEAPVTPPDDQAEPTGEFEEAPEGFYDLDRGPYIPEGAVDGQTSPDYTDDPAELAQRYSAAKLTEALRQGLNMGAGFLPFEGGDELVNAEAIYNALKEQGVDADQIVDSIYRGEKGEARPEVLPDEEANLGEDVPEAPVAEEAEEDELPALLDGLSQEEKEAVREEGGVDQYLGENKVYEDDEVPEGYYKINEDNFRLIPEDVPEQAPENVNLAPIDIANDFEAEELKEELRRALEPAIVPGYGVLAFVTPEGENYLVNVPAEALRDALKLQDEDVEAIIDEIYAEGFRGQEADEPSPEEVEDAIEGEDIEVDEPQVEVISVADVRVDDVIKAKDGTFKRVTRKSPTDDGPIFDFEDGKREKYDFEDEVERQLAEAPAEEPEQPEEPVEPEAPEEPEQAEQPFLQIKDMNDQELSAEWLKLKTEIARYIREALDGGSYPKERYNVVRERIRDIQAEQLARRQQAEEQEPEEAPEPADVVDVEPDSVFPDGKMRIADKEYAENLDNVEQIFRGGIKVEQLLPGDFVRARREADDFWQVVAIRGGEEFNVADFKRVVFVQKPDGEQRRVYWNQNAFLDEVRRPKNRNDLVAGEGDPVANPEPERPADATNVIPVDVVAGQGFVRMKQDGGDFLAEVILNDEDGNPLYNMVVRRDDAPEAERIAKAAVQEFARALASQRRVAAGEEEKKEESVAVGDAPENAGEIPIVEQIDNLPFGKGENEVTPKPDENGVQYESNARVLDDGGDVQAQVVENFPTQNKALEEGRKNVEQEAQDIADRIAGRNRLASEGRGRENLPEIPDQYRRQVFIRLLAGLYADADGNPLAVGDRVIHVNPNKAQEYGEGVVINKVQGKIGGLQRAGVVYVDYVIVEYPDGRRRKFASRFQRHQDQEVAKQRFDAEERINWMNQDEMDIALEERRKKPRKNDEAPNAEEKQEAQAVEEVVEKFEENVGPQGPVGDKFNDLENREALIEGLERVAEEYFPKFRNTRAPRPLRYARRDLDDLIQSFRFKNLEQVLERLDQKGANRLKTILVGIESYKAKQNDFPDKYKAALEVEDALNDLRDRVAARQDVAREERAKQLRENQAKPFPENFLQIGRDELLKDKDDAVDKLDAKLAELQPYLPDNGRGDRRFGQADFQFPDPDGQRAFNALADFRAAIKRNQERDAANKYPIDKLLERNAGNIRQILRSLEEEAEGKGPAKEFYEKLVEAYRPLAENLSEAPNAIRAKRNEEQLRKLAQPIPDDLVKAGENINKDDLGVLIDEAINRLPRREDLDDFNANPAVARDRLVDYRVEIDRAENVADIPNNNLSKAIVELEKEKALLGNDLLDDLIEKLETQKNNIARQIREGKVPEFGGPGLTKVDVEARAQERVDARENIFEPNSAVVGKLGQNAVVYELAEGQVLKPFKEEYEEFFTGEAKPLGLLSYRARQALQQFVGRELKEDVNTPEEDRKAFIDLAFQLDEEERAYLPKRAQLTGEAEVFRQIPATRAFSVKKGEELLGPDNKPTGWIKDIVGGGGINDTQRFTHNVTGQTLWIKREKTRREADAEFYAAELANALNIQGAPIMERFQADEQALFLNGAGEDIRGEGPPNEAGQVSIKQNEYADRFALIGVLKFGLLDILIANSDRHRANFLARKKAVYGVDDNGYDDWNVIPIDHGFAQAINGGRYEVDIKEYMEYGGRNGGEMNRDLADKLGRENYREMLLRALRDGKENYLGMYGQDGGGVDQRQILIERMDEILDWSDSDWDDVFDRMRVSK